MASYGNIKKTWLKGKVHEMSVLKTESGRQALESALFDTLDNKIKSTAAKDLKLQDAEEIFGLKKAQDWPLRESTYEPPSFLLENLVRLREANYDNETEAYGRLTIDFFIIACMLQYKDILSKQSEPPADLSRLVSTDHSKIAASDPTAAISPTVEQSEAPTQQFKAPANNPTAATFVPATPILAPESTFKPLPMKVFPEMHLDILVTRNGKTELITGVADWAMGYGKRTQLEDGAILLAIEAKRKTLFSTTEPQLITYLATIRQLRIQAKKTNVTTQGFYSDGELFKFICIRNDGTVMHSDIYNIERHSPSFKKSFKAIFNFLLQMLFTAAESSPNTSPVKPGKEQDESIENFDRNVFVEVLEEIDAE